MADDDPVRCEQVVPTLGVGDVAAALEHYTSRLGFVEAWRWGDPPAHAAVTFDEAEIHLSGSEPNPGGSWLYFVVSDVDALHARLQENGVDIAHAPEEQEWDMREMAVRDLVGNELTFASPCMTREPKLVVERDELSVRLEKRILAVVRDIAESKGMSVTEMLEETLLHTFESWEGGVASPHTQRDLEHIQTLKEKHGIDYDTHASYRFIEDAEAEPDEG